MLALVCRGVYGADDDGAREPHPARAGHSDPRAAAAHWHHRGVTDQEAVLPRLYLQPPPGT
eukprot:3515053-Rhodomonas_salina.1